MLSELDFDAINPGGDQTLMLDRTELDDLTNAIGGSSQGKPQIGVSRNQMGPVAQQKGPSVIENYKHKGLNTLYYMKPDTQSVYLLDFKKQTFMKERVRNGKIPTGFTSVQTENGRIHLVGGYQGDAISKSCYTLEQDLSFYESSSMRTARYATPICLLKDQYIIAAGGLTSLVNKGRATSLTEILDTKTQTWIPLTSM
jgi:hypothetical protein